MVTNCYKLLPQGKVIFKTTDYLDSIDKMLKELFVSTDFNIDSDSDGLVDGIEPINDKVDSIVDKLGGDTITGVQDVIGDIDYSTTESALQGLPKVQTEFMGLNIKVLDLDDSRFLSVMEDIRLLVLAIMTISFIFLVLSFFNVNFKV